MQLDTISYRFTADEWTVLGRHCDLGGFPIAPVPETEPERAEIALEQDGILVTIGQEARLDALVYKLLTFCGNRGTPRFRVSDSAQTFHLMFGKALAVLVEETPDSAAVLTPYPTADRMLDDLRKRIKWPAQCGTGAIDTYDELTAAITAYRGAKED